MSAAMIGALSWPTIVFFVMVVQAFIIWRLRVRIRDLSEYEYWYYNQSAQPQPMPQSQSFVQSRMARRSLRRR